MRIGVDLGGTKIEVIALGNDGRTMARQRIPTPDGPYEVRVKAIVDLVRTIERELGVEGTVGVATPGAISPQNGCIKNSNSTVLIGRPLDRDLSAALGRDVRLSNDANCFVLSEATDGAAATADVVFGVIIGTGTGAGVFVRGTVLGGANAIAGEWGHNPLPWPHPDELPGPLCYCGKRGCIETFLSGPGFARDFSSATGISLSPPAIVELGDTGDASATACLARYEDRMARSFAHVINILDPDVIVVGGGMSNISRLYAHVPVALKKYVFSDTVETRIVPPAYGDSSGARGAAWLWPK